jgi:hypothetical protein
MLRHKRGDWSRPRPFPDITRRLQRIEENLARRAMAWEPSSVMTVLCWLAAPVLAVLLAGLLVPH